MIPILILAAGASSRMRGRDKLLEEVDGIALLRRQVLRAQATGAPVLVTLPDAPHRRYGVLAGLDLHTVPVPHAAEGMNASLRAGLSALPKNAAGVMVVLADMPEITVDDLKTVLQAVDFKSENLIWRATTARAEPGHPIVFHRSLLPELMALHGDQGGSAVVKAHQNRTVFVPLPGAHARTDLDTPEAWAAWRDTM